MRLNVLGPIELVAAEQPVPAGPPKQRALLALLTIHGGRVLPVDLLIDELWSGRPPPSAHGGLQVYVSNLRRLLEPHRTAGAAPELLVSAADGYGLMANALELDAREFTDAAAGASTHLVAGRHEKAAAALTSALALWRGEPYADVRSASWAQTEIGRLQQLRHHATEQLGEALTESGRHAEAVTLLEQFVREQPLRERAWELLALSHYRTGHQAAALEALRGIRELLANELGLDPGQRLRDLEAAILRQDVGTAPTDATSRPVSCPARPPVAATSRPIFVGRQSALELLADAARTSQSDPQLVLIDGEPGSGKTTLLNRFTDTLRVPVGRGTSPDHETAPALWPWERVLRDLIAAAPTTDVPAEVSAFLAGDGTASASTAVDADGGRLRFYDAVARLLTEIGPATVILEDIHAADEATLRLLVHVASSAPPGLLLVASLRRHEASALSGTLSCLSRCGARRLDLDGLTADEVRELVRDISGDDPGPARAEELARHTSGNPFFVAEVARAGTDAPRGVLDVVLHRVDALGTDVVRVLELAAIMGDEFDATILAEVIGDTLEVLLTTLETATHAGLVTESPDRFGAYEFAHALMIDALLSRRSRLWRATANEKVGRALTSSYGQRDDRASAIARCWLAAAELGTEPARMAMDYCARAARCAMRRYAAVDAAASWEESIAAAELAGADAAERFELILGLAESRYAAGLFDDGYAAIEQALAIAPDWVDVVRTADVAMGHGIWVPFRYGLDVRALQTSIDGAVSHLSPSAPSALAYAVSAVLAAHSGREDSIEQSSSLAVAAAEQHGDAELLLRVLHLRLIAMHGQDFGELRTSTARRLVAQPGLPAQLRTIAQLHVVVDLVAHAEVSGARDLLAQIGSGMSELHNPALALQAAAASTGLDLLQGVPDPARHLVPIHAMLAVGDVAYFEAGMLAVRAETLIQEERLGEDAAWIEEMYRLTGLAGLGFALAKALTERGETDRARQVLQDTPVPPRDYHWAMASMCRLHAAIALDDRDIIREVYDAFEPFAGTLLVNGTCTTIDGAYDGHLGEALLALGDPDGARVHLIAAVDLLDAAGAGYWLSRARQALAKCT